MRRQPLQIRLDADSNQILSEIVKLRDSSKTKIINLMFKKYGEHLLQLERKSNEVFNEASLKK